jgi:hypothetical protein
LAPKEEISICGVRLQLEEHVRHTLRKLAILAAQEADLIASDDEPKMDAVDEDLENVLGEKERAIGALKQHRAEHGC